VHEERDGCDVGRHIGQCERCESLMIFILRVQELRDRLNHAATHQRLRTSVYCVRMTGKKKKTERNGTKNDSSLIRNPKNKSKKIN
jgi:hypothetical protein